MVEIDANDQPKGLQVAIYDNASRAYNDPPAQVLKLETGFTAPFAVDVPAGTYYLRISGQWDEGGVSYKFKMVVAKWSIMQAKVFGASSSGITRFVNRINRKTLISSKIR